MSRFFGHQYFLVYNFCVSHVPLTVHLNCLHHLGYREQGCVVNMEANDSLTHRFIQIYTKKNDCWGMKLFFLKFSKNYDPLSDSGCVNFHSHGECVTAVLSLHLQQHWLSSLSLIKTSCRRDMTFHYSLQSFHFALARRNENDLSHLFIHPRSLVCGL